MPAPTLSERVADLEATSVLLKERLDGYRSSLKTLKNVVQRHTDDLEQLKIRFAILDEKLRRIEETASEGSRRRWSLVPPVVGVVIGSVLTLLIQLLLKYWPNNPS